MLFQQWKTPSTEKITRSGCFPTGFGYIQAARVWHCSVAMKSIFLPVGAVKDSTTLQVLLDKIPETFFSFVVKRFQLILHVLLNLNIDIFPVKTMHSNTHDDNADENNDKGDDVKECHAA